ncbi:MAG: Threonylcarbamoyladenosine tRNA methylthiotransferase MtaB [Chlamydiales bacterium]|nr:Threonylcarbamoyladenosine tRNA methylthiotransferase MtaB [Chlamydiales bacterium]MCH9620584.1 Threonylcarbamoyladenosine tRNA methylthiotransferase MtaB [Chlamydiales bacterium]MCH9623544.1 Threonylcarbamoyladenosine tRNA methylthiotransferase MtaB [Chlamydiales bacterium]
MKKKFKIATLGCRTNQYESQAYRDQLEALGYEEAGSDEKADLCIVNTCTVTQSADSSSRHQIRQLVKQNSGAEVVVTGCLAQRRPDLIEKIGGVSRVIPNKEKEQLIERLFPDVDNLPEFSIKNFEAHTRAFVKVQDGCNSYCTYCIIPYVRGKSRSRPIGDVVEEVERLVASGYKEVVITGINVGDYEEGLAKLLRAVDCVEGLKRLRLSSIDPDEVDDELLDVIVNGKTTCQSMHLVLQAGSNAVLKRMNRKYTRQMFIEAVERLKKASPDFTFTTDLIVGFPGETDDDFKETVAVMEEVKFAKVHMFPYSPRERTRAALYTQLDPSIIAERKQHLLRAAEKVAFELREEYVGRIMTVLTEDREGGHTDNFLPVKIGEHRSNELVQVKIIENRPEGLVGVL